MNFKLNKEYNPGDSNDERFMLIDGIEALREQSLGHLRNLADPQTDAEWSMAAHALSGYMKYSKLLDKMYPSDCGTPRTKVEYGTEAVQEVQAMVNAAHNEELSKQEGHVVQVWADGEVTSQKSGDLLWQRSIHASIPGFPGVDFPIEWPGQTRMGGYIFCVRSDAVAIHRKILQLTTNGLLK